MPFQFFTSQMELKHKDVLFAQAGAPEKFEFDENVARIFEDMLERSVPLYRECQDLAARWCLEFAQEHSNIYDLGCSTGTFLWRLAKRLAPEKKLRLIGIDLSEPMLEKARQKLQFSDADWELRRGDLDGPLDLADASVAVMNYTLQFIPPERRPVVMEKIFRGLHPGGALVLIEKVASEHGELDPALMKFYHEFKRDRGYSNLEIARKREALENVLIPWKTSQNMDLLKNAGFRAVEVFFRWNNFAGFIALK